MTSVNKIRKKIANFYEIFKIRKNSPLVTAVFKVAQH